MASELSTDTSLSIESMEPTTLDFMIVSKLADGTGCQVYRAVNNKTCEPVVLKIFEQSITSRKLYFHELVAYRRLVFSNRASPKMVKFYGCGSTADNMPLLVLQYIAGPTLAEHLEKHGPMNEKVALFTLAQLVSALVSLQEHRLVHRDVKPENVLFDATTGAIKLIDLGLACSLRADTKPEETMDERRSGTPRYMAPELLDYCVPVCLVKCDVWSAGMTFWEMLLGFYPFFSCKRLDHLKTHIAAMDLSGLPLLATFILQRMLKTSVAERLTLTQTLELIMSL